MRKATVCMLLMLAGVMPLRADWFLESFTCSPTTCTNEWDGVYDGSTSVTTHGTCTIDHNYAYPSYPSTYMTLYANTCENPVDLAPLGGGDTANPPFVYATGTVYQPSGTLNAIWYGERQAYCNGSTGSNVPPNVPC